MNLAELVTILSFIGFFAILALKFINITAWGKWYKPPLVYIGFAAYFITWLLLFATFVQVPENNLYRLMFLLCSLFIPINLLLTFIEMLLMYTTLPDLVKKGFKVT